MNSAHWLPSATMATLRQRAAIIAQIRQFFVSRHYLEVETPIMARHGITDIYLSNIQASFRGQPYYLQTSPEYHMKRLLAAGSGSIFQISRVFRDDELGRWHNPEFSLLEWYQLDINHLELLKEVDEFLQLVLHCGPIVRKTYRQAFLEACELDPFVKDDARGREVLAIYGLENVIPMQETDWDQFLFLLMSHVVEPALAKEASPVAILDFPVSQAALAQTNNGVAERFEVYFKGVELANGFHELTDASSQAERFRQDISKRQNLGLPTAYEDVYLLEALEHGLPPCSGVALGIDRLLALALNTNSIAETQAFDFSRG